MRERLRLSHAAGDVWFYDSTAPTIGMHRHTELEVNLGVRGTARYLFSDRSFDLRAGTQLWMFPSQEHVLVDRSPDFRMWIGVFRPRMVRETCDTPATAILCKSNPREFFCRQISDTDAHAMADLCQRVTKETDESAARAGLAWLLVSAWRAYQAAGQPAMGKPVHPAVERAARLLRDAADEIDAMKIDELARRCGLSPSRLSRLFKKQAGVSLVKFRQQKRIERFFELYRSSDHREENILTTALRVGFGSYPQFHRVFKQTTGESPRDYYRDR